MGEELVPLPRQREVALAPGFWLDVLAATEQSEDWDMLDDQEGALRAWIAWAESHNVDVLEAQKGWRCIERRRGQLLGPREPGRRTDTEPVPRVEPVAKATAHRWRLIAEHWDDLIYPHLLQATEPKWATQTVCIRLITEHTPAEPDADVADMEGGRWATRHGDFRDVLGDLDDGSVDLIVTDPPYPKDDLALWSDLGKTAARLLGPRGILFGWSGQIFLPTVLAMLGEHLTYGWTFALHLPGSGSRIMGRHIIQAWKPVLAFTTGTWPSGEWGDDFLVSPEREKDDYAWQQHAAPAARLIERYSPPDGLVVDPFLGTGAFGLAAIQTGRRFIGVELDAGRFKTATERLTQ